MVTEPPHHLFLAPPIARDNPSLALSTTYQNINAPSIKRVRYKWRNCLFKTAFGHIERKTPAALLSDFSSSVTKSGRVFSTRRRALNDTWSSAAGKASYFAATVQTEAAGRHTSNARAANHLDNRFTKAEKRITTPHMVFSSLERSLEFSVSMH